MKKNKQHKVKAISIGFDEFNHRLDLMHNSKFIYNEPTTVSNNVYLFSDRRNNEHLIYKTNYAHKVVHFVFDPYTGEVDELQDVKRSAGRLAIRHLHELAKKYNEMDIDSECNNSNYSWEAYFDHNPKYAYKDIEGCYEYDQGSSYPSYFKYPLPYGPIIGRNRLVNEGEIGFDIIINKEMKKVLIARFEGEDAEIIFKTKIFKCMCEYADEFYAAKEACAEGSIERQKIKIKLNALHGALKYHNVYISCAIIGYAKRYMEQHKPDNWLIITVDSFTTLGPMTGLPIGNELGQFKIKHENEGLYYESHAIKYWEKGEVKHAGLKKSHIGLYKTRYAYDYNEKRMKDRWQETED